MTLLTLHRQACISSVALSLAVLSIPAHSHVSQSVIAQRIGTTCEDALRQAKSQATEQVAGSFINSQRTLRNDSEIEESVNEYTAGVVTKFMILDTDNSRLCKVTIKADIDVNRSLVSQRPAPNKGIDLGHIGSLAQNRKDGVATLTSLVDRPDQFRVDVSKVAFNQGAKSTRIDLLIDQVTYTEQCVNDLEAILSVQNKPYVYEKPSLVKALLTLAALPITLPVAIITAPFTSNTLAKETQNPENSLCFSRDATLDRLSCYDGPLASELISQLSDLSINPVLKDRSGNLYPLPHEKRFSLISNYLAEVPLQQDGTKERRQKFIVVKPAKFSTAESIYLDDRILEPGFTLFFTVKKASRR